MEAASRACGECSELHPWSWNEVLGLSPSVYGSSGSSERLPFLLRPGNTLQFRHHNCRSVGTLPSPPSTISSSSRLPSIDGRRGFSRDWAWTCSAVTIAVLDSSRFPSPLLVTTSLLPIPIEHTTSLSPTTIEPLLLYCIAQRPCPQHHLQQSNHPLALRLVLSYLRTVVLSSNASGTFGSTFFCSYFFHF